MAIIKPQAKKFAKNFGGKAGGKGHGGSKGHGGNKGHGGGKGGGGKGGGGGGNWVFVPAGAPAPSFQRAPQTQRAPQPQRGGKGIRKGGKQQVPFDAFGGKGHGGKGHGKAASPQDERHKKAMDKLSEIDAERKVWVGGLDKDVGFGKLQKHFKELQCKPSVCEIMKRGTACLSFQTAEEASTAIDVVNGSELGGKAIEVDVWTQKEKKERPQRQEGLKPKAKAAVQKHQLKTKSAGQVAGKKGKNDNREGRMAEKLALKIKEIDRDLKVWVGGLKPSTTWKELKQHFVDNGCEVNMCVVTKPGTAVVTFATTDEASSAISTVNDTDLDGKTIQVDTWSRPEKGKKNKAD